VFFFPIVLIGVMLTNIIPKKNIWLINEWFGESFKDNGKIFYEYIKNLNVKTYWLTKNKKLIKTNPNLIYLYSPKSLYLHLVSKVFIISHSILSEFIPFLISPNSKVIHFYHGVPIKYVENDSNYSKSNNFFFKSLSKIFPFIRKRFDLLIALNEVNKNHLKSAFQCDESKIKVTGFPRYDNIFSKTKQTETNRPIKQKTIRILYQPTFQGKPGDYFVFHNENKKISLNKLSELINNQNISIDIKLHPASKLRATDVLKLKKIRKIKLLKSHYTLDKIGYNYDCFMTDFSGSYFDFLPFKKPIIINLTGINDYLRSSREGFYYNISELSSNTFDNWQNLEKEIKKIKKKDVEYFLNKHHYFQDSLSCQRIHQEIIKLLSH